MKSDGPLIILIQHKSARFTEAKYFVDGWPNKKDHPFPIHNFRFSPMAQLG